ncbi:hypothetical protein J6X90_01115 [Candidatus Saccharibacteria bacterium]|nr:hypothetical protein [Candidatus Saccharibacteria bacterium]
MKIRNLLGAAAIVVATTFTSANVNAVSCPSGSKKTSASTLAACDIVDDDSLIPTLETIIEVIIGLLGLVAVIFIVLGAVSFVTSEGDPGKVKKAKDTILYGVIGVVVALLAYAIVNFVLSSVFSSSTTGGGGSPDPVPTPTKTV